MKALEKYKDKGIETLTTLTAYIFFWPQDRYRKVPIDKIDTEKCLLTK